MIKSERPKEICTECFFTGQPNISLGRLFIEFLLNLLFIGGAPLFQKVRHCPECGSHSMVAVTSEAGQAAIEKQNKIQQDEKPGHNHENFKSSSHNDLEYTRTRMQR